MKNALLFAVIPALIPIAAYATEPQQPMVPLEPITRT